MNKSEVAEIKKTFTKETCSVDRFSACLVDDEKNKTYVTTEALLSLPEEELARYLDIFHKALSGTLGKNLINIDFPPSLKEIGATGMGDSVFRQVTSLKCFSYLGSTNFESGNFFNNEPVVHVSNANYPEGKNFAYKKPLRDDKTCRKSNPLPNAQKNKCKYSIIACNHHPNLLCAMVFLLAS